MPCLCFRASKAFVESTENESVSPIRQAEKLVQASSVQSSMVMAAKLFAKTEKFGTSSVPDLPRGNAPYAPQPKCQSLPKIGLASPNDGDVSEMKELGTCPVPDVPKTEDTIESGHVPEVTKSRHESEETAAGANAKNIRFS